MIDPSQVERWRRIDALFAEATALPASARDAFLRAACAEDEELRLELESLLQSDARPEDLLGEVVESAARDVADQRPAASAPLAGELLGPYRVIGILGRGGMSSVYRAVRADDEYSKEVAVKILQSGFLGPDTLERFRRERQLLADLEHPYIARLLDGGTREDGTPFVVMELVDGPPIDEYARRENLGLAPRIALFRKVCAAVQYAHQRLVVHRDLKPSNILVQPDGTPKLLDFGIAKLLDEDEVAATVTAQRWMTPEYASPEQVRGERVSTASDVYSLGAVLYELLTDRRPYRFPSRGAGDIERVVCETMPPPPSAALAERAAESEPPPTRPIRSRELRGDLDNIVLMALRKEPERRYGSAGELDADLERFERGLPVRSRPDTFRYRSRKFVRRHRLAVAAAAALVTLLVAFGAVTFFQARRLEVERDAANLERDKARRVAELFGEMLTAEDDAGVPAGDLTARQLVDRGAARLASQELDDQPAVRAALLQAVGDVFLFHEEVEPARKLLDEALVLRRGLGGEDDLEVAESLDSLGDLARREEDLDQALALAREALGIRRRLAGEPSAEVVASLIDVARVLHTRGEFVEAERTYAEALGQARQLPGHRALVLELMQAHAGLVGTISDPDAMLATLWEVLEGSIELFGENHLRVADVSAELAVDLRKRKRYDEAEPLYLRALAIRRATLGAHEQTAQALNNYGLFLKEKGAMAEAGEVLAEAVGMYEEVYGPDHPGSAIGITNYAAWLRDNGSVEEAARLYEKAIALEVEGPLGPDHWVVAIHRYQHATCLMKLGEEERAERELERSVETLLDKHPRHGGARVAVGLLEDWYEKHGRIEDAAALRERATARGVAEPSS
jgi:serine/threonine-protein kinase